MVQPKNSAVQIVDPHTVAIAQLNERFQSILNTPIPVDKAEQLRRLEDMELLSFDFFKEASNTYEKAWSVIFLIIEEGLWKRKQDNDGNYYRDYPSYVQSLYDLAGKYISTRTIHSRVTQFRTLGDLGIDASTRVDLLENQPHILKKLLNKVVDSHGDVRELDPVARKTIIETVGLEGVGVTEMSDREIVTEFVSHMPELDHKDSSNIISRLIREWKKNFTWLRRDKIFVVRFYQAGVKPTKKPVELRFQLIGGDVTHPEARKFLERMIQG